MKLLEKEWLQRLGAGERVAALCQTLGITPEEFDQRWKRTNEARVPPASGACAAAVSAAVEIERDRWGIPHIYAQSDADLFFGLGFAMSQDRLFQLDYLRRKGLGRLAEILGQEGLASDLIARTVGLGRIAAAEWQRLPAHVQGVLQAFSAGVNAFIETCDVLPIEFDLLGYRPEPWAPLDSLAIENEFRWYLTGRFPVIVMPELARRMLGDGPLYREYLLGEADQESIVWPGEYGPRGSLAEPVAHDWTSLRTEPVGHVVGDPEAAVGSNNWVLAGGRTTTGLPLVASDPHIAFEAVSCWYEAHLCGGSYNVAGMAYVGMPAIMFGRNTRVAWGITNNICSLRDLYQERSSPDHPDCFLYDGKWEPARQLVETINVRGAEPVTKTIRFSRNGPVVDEILPWPKLPASVDGESWPKLPASVDATKLPASVDGATDAAGKLAACPTRVTGPVTLKWLGMHQGGWLTALLTMGRATDSDSFREALRPWHVPTFSLVFADVDGRIGFQSAGRIPLRKSLERAYRPGWDPEHQWQGLISFEGMPGLADPDRGWIATANNRVAPDDYPYPLFGCWSSGWRAARIRQMIESQERHSPADVGQMQQDAMSLRAADLVPALLATIKGSSDCATGSASARVLEAVRFLEAWDFVIEADSVAATIFNVFFSGWCKVVAEERFSARSNRIHAVGEKAKPDESGYYEQLVNFMSAGVQGLAGRLLKTDPAGWFAEGNRQQRIVDAFRRALDLLSERFGPEMSQWRWGRLHVMPLKHVLSSRGDLGRLLDHGGAAVRGDMVTVCNTGSGPEWIANSGAGYRLLADLAESPPVLRAVDAQSQSGNPGSQHYGDQFDDWAAGRYHEIHLDRQSAANATVETFRLVPP